MKLRCTTNSIRLRLRRSEVEQLLEKAEVEESVSFTPDKIFRFCLHLDPTAEQVQAHQEACNIRLSIPRNLGEQWIKSDMVGIEAEQPIGDGRMLHLLIEKDFPCMTRPDEDKADFFGNLQANEPAVC